MNRYGIDKNVGSRNERKLPGLKSFTIATNKQTSKTFLIFRLLKLNQGFPGGAVVENPPANAGDTGSSPGLGGSHMPRSN